MFSITARRTFSALASSAALAVAVAPAASAAPVQKGPAAPPKAHDVFGGSVSKAQKSKMRRAATSPAGVRKAGLQGKDTISVYCGAVQRAYWGYWIKCHVVYVGGAYGYTDWYEYDYWNGSSWSYWFDALS